MMKFKEFKGKYKIRNKDIEDIRFINVKKCISDYSDLERWKLRAVTKEHIEKLNYEENIFLVFSLFLTGFSLLFPHSGKGAGFIFFVIIYIIVISYIFFIRGLKKHRYVYLLSMLEEYETEQGREKKFAEVYCHQARNVVESMTSPEKELTFSYAEQFFSDHHLSFTNFVENKEGALALIDADGGHINAIQLLSDQCVYSIKCTVFDGTGKRKVKLRQEFSGSVLKQMEDAYDYIRSSLHSTVEGRKKSDDPDFLCAIREALLNMIIHRDYDYSGSNLVNIFRDRIEFVSLGGLVKGIILDDIMEGVSQPRNLALANIFCKLELTESCGTGIQRIIECYEKSVHKPVFHPVSNSFRVMLPKMLVADEG